VRERIPLRVDLVEALERRAAARGEGFETTAARALARGAARVLIGALGPLLDDDQEVERRVAERPSLPEGST
jgi:hypothetical protein